MISATRLVRNERQHDPCDGRPESPEVEQTEAELIAKLRQGDARAYECLVRQYGPMLLAVARRIMRHEEDSADVVQDALLSAFRNLHTFQETARISTWLHRIVVNAALMKLRASGRRPSTSLDELLPQFDATGHHASGVARWTDNPLSQLSDAETRQQVRDSIDRLPEDYRIVILLRDIEQLDTEQTAQVLGISLPLVKTRLHRARQALRALLDPIFGDEAARDQLAYVGR